MKIEILQTMFALAFASASLSSAPMARAETAIPDWSHEGNGFHSCNVGDPDWMSPRLNLIYRVPTRHWDPTDGAWRNGYAQSDALARFAAEIESIISEAFDSARNAPYPVNIFIFVGGTHWRLSDRGWNDIYADICPAPTESETSTIPEPYFVSAALGLGVGATAVMRRVRRRGQAS